jgi:hypothetical protein
MKSKLLYILFAISCVLLNSKKLYAGNYSWTGTTSTSWSVSTNWNPNGVPSTSDSVTITNQTNNPLLNANKSVKKITMTSGTLNLNSYTLTISDYCTFNGGTIDNGLVYLNKVFGTSDIKFNGTTFGARVKITGTVSTLINSTFNDSLIVEQYGSPLSAKGGNTFGGFTTFTNPLGANIILSDSLPDTFNGALEITNQGGAIYLAHRGTGNQFNGTVKLTGKDFYICYYGTASFNQNINIYPVTIKSKKWSSVYFGYSTGSCSLSSGKTITIDTTVIRGSYYFQNFTQNGSGSFNFHETDSVHFYFKTGTTFNANLTCYAPFIHLDGSRFLGNVTFTNNATANVTSLGGCYFGDSTYIVNNSSSSHAFTIGSTIADTFQAVTTIRNNTGIISINNAIFNNNVALNNYDSSTTSNRFFLNNTGQTKFKGILSIYNYSSGMLFGEDGSSSIEDNGEIEYISNGTGNIVIKNFTQQNTTDHVYSLTSANSKLILDGGNTFNGNFSFNGQNIEVNGTTFNGTVTINKFGAINNVWNGGNIFNDTVVISDSSTSGHYLKMGNSVGDIFNGNVSFIQKSAGVIYPSYNYQTTFNGNVTVGGVSSTTFGENGGRSVFSGTLAQSINNSSSYVPLFKKLIIDKSAGDLTLNTNANVSDSLILSTGIIKTDSLSYITILDNGIVFGGDETSFVEGFLKKVGNDSFTFPFGNRNQTSKYHPLLISPPSTTSDAFFGSYNPSTISISNNLDSVDISNCEYWKLVHTNGSSTINCSIGIGSNSCFLNEKGLMRIAIADSLGWKDLGKSSMDFQTGFLKIASDSNLSTVTGRSYYITNAQKWDRYRMLNSVSTNPIEARGMYVDKFYTPVGGGIDPNRSILGVWDASTSSYKKEVELLEFARNNHIELLVLYDFRKIDMSNNTVNGLTMKDHLCRFITTAKNDYCIPFIGIALGATSNELHRYEQWDHDYSFITPPITLPNEISSFYGPNNPLSFVENTLSPTDPDLIPSEIAKTVINAMYMTGCTTPADIDLITLEYEFWNAKPDAAHCDFLSNGNPYPSNLYCNNADDICHKQPAFSCMLKNATQYLNNAKMAHNSSNIHQVRTALYLPNLYPQYIVGPGITTSTPTSSRSPYKGDVAAHKQQILVPASELVNKGFLPGSQITNVAFDVVPGYTPLVLDNFTVAVKTTSTTSLTSTFETGTSVVFGPVSYTPRVGINVHAFSTPITWNGTDNLIIETCFSNASAGSSNNIGKLYRAQYGASNTNNYVTKIDNVCSSTTGATPDLDPPTIMINVNPLEIAQFIDNVPGTQLYSPEKWDVLFPAHYTANPNNGYVSANSQLMDYVYQDNRTMDGTVINPLFNCGSLSQGDDGNYYGYWFKNLSVDPTLPLSQRNMFVAERNYYDDWVADPNTATASNKNIVSPNAFQWFTYSYFKHLLGDNTILFQSNSPQCVSNGSQAIINFTYQGPLDAAIPCTLEVRDITNGTLFNQQIRTTPIYAPGNTVTFSPCTLSVGEYEATLKLKYVYVTPSGTNTCEIPYTQRVTVSQSPRIDALEYSSTSSITVCQDQNVILQASSINVGGSYQWRRDGIDIPSATSQEYVATISGVYSCMITNGGPGSLCSGLSNDISITVTPNPLIHIAVLCDGAGAPAGVDLKVVPYNGGTISWYPSGSTETKNVSSAGHYSVQVSNGSGECISSASVDITSAELSATDPGTLQITTSDPTIICQGNQSGNITLNVTSGFDSYLWSTSQTSATSISIPPPSFTTDYFVYATKGPSQCSKIASKTITIVELNVLSSATPSTICNGSTLTLTANGATNYSWIPSSGLACSTCSSTTVSPTSSTIYTVIGSDPSGCTKSSTVSVTVNSNPSTSISKIDAVCVTGPNNGSASVTPSGGTPPYVYAWSPGGASTSTINNLAQGDYTCIITDDNDCITSSTVHVGSSTGFSVTSTSTTSANCVGGNADGAATATVTPSGTYTYSWSGSTQNTTSHATQLSPGNYIVYASHNSCTASASVTVGNNITYDFTSPVITGPGTTNWNFGTTKTVSGVIVIEDGGVLDISNNTTVEFSYKVSSAGGGVTYYQAGVFVKPGGKLIVRGGSVLKGCGTGVWDGIKAPGNRNAAQLATLQPVVEITSATIKNAYAGVAVFSYNYFYESANLQQVPQEQSGGILIANGATFENNKVAIQFASYPNSLISTIDGCSFIYDNNSPFRNDYTANKPMRFLDLRGIHGLIIANSHFTSSVTGLDASLRGTGILGTGVGIKLQGITGVGSGDNDFNNLTTGIQLINYLLPYKNQIEGNQFNGVYQGIYVQNGWTDNFKLNKFNVPAISGNVAQAYGMHLINCRALNIESNDFYSPSSISSTYGIAFSNCGGVVFQNYFHKYSTQYTFDVSIQTDDNCNLLAFRCNKFEDPYQYSLLVNTGVIKQQGVGCATDVEPANNQWLYSQSCTNGEQMLKDAPASGFIYYSLQYNLSMGNTFIPSCRSTSIDYRECTGLQETSTSCANPFPILPPRPKKNEDIVEYMVPFMDDVGDYSDAIETQIAIFNDSITENSQNEVMYNNEILSLEFEKVYQASEIENIEGVKNTLIDINKTEFKRKLADIYYAQNNDDSLDIILTEIENDEEFDESEKDNYLDLLGHIENATDTDGILVYDSLSDVQLTNIINSNTSSSYIAEVFLNMKENEYPVHEIPPINNGEYRIGGKYIDRKFENLEIYPNPTNSLINVVYKVVDTDNLKLVLIDMYGKIVFSKILIEKNAKLEINISSLSQGVYQLLINNADDILLKSKINIIR